MSHAAPAGGLAGRRGTMFRSSLTPLSGLSGLERRALELLASKRALDRARRRGDRLAAELAESALNHQLEHEHEHEDNREGGDA